MPYTRIQGTATALCASEPVDVRARVKRDECPVVPPH
jgi:hypothetical protein